MGDERGENDAEKSKRQGWLDSALGHRGAGADFSSPVSHARVHLAGGMMVGTRPTSRFAKLARASAHFMGRPVAFGTALGIIFLWLILGPVFDYSDTWQLLINTGTTIVTFLMVFLIQHTQNKDAEAMHIKLDELIRAVDKAQNALLNLEDLEEQDLDRIRSSYVNLADQARAELRGSDHVEAALAPNGSARG
jgi:low affinity Fe/Cu permease